MITIQSSKARALIRSYDSCFQSWESQNTYKSHNLRVSGVEYIIHGQLGTRLQSQPEPAGSCLGASFGFSSPNKCFFFFFSFLSLPFLFFLGLLMNLLSFTIHLTTLSLQFSSLSKYVLCVSCLQLRLLGFSFQNRSVAGFFPLQLFCSVRCRCAMLRWAERHVRVVYLFWIDNYFVI